MNTYEVVSNYSFYGDEDAFPSLSLSEAYYKYYKEQDIDTSCTLLVVRGDERIEVDIKYLDRRVK